MKISELVHRLSVLRELEGDINVVVEDFGSDVGESFNDEYFPIFEVKRIYDDNGNPVIVII